MHGNSNISLGGLITGLVGLSGLQIKCDTYRQCNKWANKYHSFRVGGDNCSVLTATLGCWRRNLTVIPKVFWKILYLKER